jgi:hypothetical protein
MKSPQHLFAELTAVIEDMHSVAVDGQAKNNSPDMQAALLAAVRESITRLVCIADAIERSLRAKRT